MTTCILYILSDIGALSTHVPSIIFKMVKLRYLTLWGTSVNDDSDSESGKTFRYQGYSRDFTFGQFPCCNSVHHHFGTKFGAIWYQRYITHKIISVWCPSLIRFHYCSKELENQKSERLAATKASLARFSL